MRLLSLLRHVEQWTYARVRGDREVIERALTAELREGFISAERRDAVGLLSHPSREAEIHRRYKRGPLDHSLHGYR